MLDNVSTRINAKDDPNRFVEILEKAVTIYEVQKVPELLESLKIYIDNHRNNGDFLIIGSANILDMKQTKDTLVGRIVELTLYSLSLKERADKAHENSVDRLFFDNFSSLKIETNRVETLDKPTIVVLDNASFHKSKKFKSNIARWSNRGLTLLYLPPYSPQLNIIETLWRFMKYIWIDYSAYLNSHNLLLYIQKIFDGYGQRYRINFY